MTAVVWDGVMMSADKRTNFGGVCVTTTKVKRLSDGTLIGSAGTAAHCRAAVNWYADGAEVENWDAAWDVHVLIVKPDRSIFMLDSNPTLIGIDDTVAAVGSSMGLALVAMACGRTAAEAVALAARFDPSCGNGIDTLTLDES